MVSNELNFLTDFDSKMPEVVIGDKHRVQQVSFSCQNHVVVIKCLYNTSRVKFLFVYSICVDLL